jgi:thioredoxin reductase/NAD-dependent dihydropyrimidine dehydrogenase PreA subunit
VNDPPLGLHARRDEPRRRRDKSTPSDVTRFRGVIVAAAVLVVTFVALAAAELGFDGIRSPGPLSASHRAHGLACGDCHATSRASDACAACHQGTRFSRIGHARSFEAGALACGDCHRAHGFDGIRFEPDGTSYVTERGVQSGPRNLGLGFRPAESTTLPLVATASCASCHRVDDPADVASMCTGAFGGERSSYSLCFDEHGPSGSSRAVRAGARDVAGQAARQALLVAPPVLPVRSRPWFWLAAALATASLALVVARRLPRSRLPGPTPAVDAAEPPRVVRLPQVDTTTCLGCYACVDACPYDVLAVERFVAVVERPDECCGLTLCEQRCPNGSLVVTSGEPLADRPRIDEHLESLDVPGLYLAGDLTGVPLIKNAIAQGERVARRVAEKRESKRRSPASDRFDLLIVGAGPAGIGAALEAKAAGLRCVTLEQGSVAESIRSFPRHKIVLAQTGDSDRPTRLWLEECRKEELLAEWQRTVRRERLDIREGQRVTSVGPGDDGFEVTAVDRDRASRVFAAKSVLLANGRRGTPRKLKCGVSPEAEASVFYSLADARSFAGQRVVVVGLGDVALEAIAALAGQPGTSVTASYRGKEFRRGKARNVATIERLAERGRVELCFESEVTSVRAGSLVMATPSGARSVRFDALFVMIGAIAPWEFLERCGMRRTDTDSDAPESDDRAPRGRM